MTSRQNEEGHADVRHHGMRSFVKVLELNEICAWAEQLGLACGDHGDVHLPDWPLLHRGRYADGRRTGRESAAAADFVSKLAEWDHCLVWLRSWGVFPSGEDWPEFYAWRGALGEHRSLEAAPGHLFEPGEVNQLTELVTLVMANAWDADVLCAHSERLGDVRGSILHHDTWEVRQTP